MVMCRETQLFWERIFNWWSQHFHTWFNIDTYEVIFGIPHERNKPVVNQINYFILLAKYIYMQKRKIKPWTNMSFCWNAKNACNLNSTQWLKTKWLKNLNGYGVCVMQLVSRQNKKWSNWVWLKSYTYLPIYFHYWAFAESDNLL